jgi:tetratricopeptide (TPR) repeat protein
MSLAAFGIDGTIMRQIYTAVLCCLALQAQHPPHSAGGAAPVSLYSGLGNWTHPIATRHKEAQRYFDQGLVLLYGFNRNEALRSFQKAAELDPRAAMARWGVAMALGPYLNMDMDPDVHVKESCEAVKTGLAIPGIGDLDSAWLQAAGTRCPDFTDPGRYVRAMRELAARVPDDPDAQTWYAEALLLPVRWRWYSPEGKPAEGVEEAERVLEAVLRRVPQHPGANHLYIHAVESSPTPERAIPSSQRLMGIVPAAGHLVHMPGHIWLVLGDYENAVAVNERAAEVDRQYFARTGMAGSYYPYYLHNLQFILYARAMQGRVALTRKAAGQISEALKPMTQSMPEMAEVFGTTLTMAELRLYRWDDVLQAGPPKSESPLVVAVGRYARALAWSGKGRLQDARREHAEFVKLRAKLDRNIPWGNNKLGDVMDLAAAILEARLESGPARAVAGWKDAVALQDRLVYDEPPAWYYPVRESLGAALLLSGDAPGAEAIFREGLRRSPNNGRMLFGLLESLKAQRKADAAEWVRREFETAWKGADVELRLGDL